MKRFHVHVGVEDLDRSIQFYSGLFGAPPTVLKNDYAKWMIDDPRLNFAISQRGGRVGVDHLGLQVDSAEELSAVRARFAAADETVLDEPAANCCYAKSDKHWVTDPQGIAWEGYHSMGEIRFFDRDGVEGAEPAGCCAPSETSHGCCTPEKATTTVAKCCA